MSLVSLAGKVALITGASSGIGRATAVLFAKLGAGVALVGRDEDRLHKTLLLCEEQTKKAGSQASHCIIKADLSILEEISTAFNKTIQHFGKLDILVNNAGIQIKDSVENFDAAAHEKLMNINVRSVLVLSNLAVPKLAETKGCIINISSVAGNRSFPGVLSYCMSKAAIEQFTKCAALELAPKGIRVNCVAPGVIVTELHRNAGMSEEEYAKFLGRAKNNSPLGHTGDSEDVANSIAFLASDATSYTTGNTIFVDGGWSRVCPR
nr:unnamed protein product [Spirometra erinaceieuropaei]